MISTLRSLFRKLIQRRPAGPRLESRRRQAPRLQELEGRTLQTAFPGADLHPINNSTVYPLSTIVRLDITFQYKAAQGKKQVTKTQHIFGTGTMIGDGNGNTFANNNHVLTAAHLLYRKEWGGYAKNVTAYVAQNGNFAIGSAVKTQIRYYPGWLNQAKNQYNYDNDFALITLNKTFRDTIGYASLGTAGTPNLFLNTAGYPGALSPNGVNMYAGGGVVSNWSKTQWGFTSINTFVGQSGSPVWWVDTSQWLDDAHMQHPRYVVGIISHETAGANYATRITPEKYAAIRSWLAQDAARAR